MKIAFQMDPIQTVNINADSTFRIAEEAQARGHELFFYTPDHLAFQEGKVTARGHYFTVQRVQGQHADLSEMREVDLADFDVVWLRQDPPFDMHYITTTHLLDLIHPDTLVVNDPFWVRNYPEKLLVLRFPDLTPPTTIARDLETIKAFNEKHGDVMCSCALHLDKQHCIVAAQNQVDFTRCAFEPMFQNAPSFTFIMPRDLKFSGLPRVIRKFTRRRFCQSPRLFDKFCALVVLLPPKSCQPHLLRTFCPTRF